MADGDKNPLEGTKDYLDKFRTDLENIYKEAFNPKNIADQMLDLDKKASEVAKTFGVGRDNIYSINKGITEAITNVTLLGGSYQDVADIQMNIATNLGRNVLSTTETVESLFKTSQVVGETSQVLVKSFKDVGMSASFIEDEMTKVVDQSRSIGVNAQAVSKQVLTNMSDLNKFNFEGGVQGMAKMAAQAVNLRVNMKDTLVLAEKMFNPEQAIEMAAAMQRLGVAQSDLLDPLRLMEMGQNDPAELQNQIAEMTKQFITMGKEGKFEVMPGAKLRLQEIAKEMGMNYGELVKMGMAGKELDDKLRKIKFPDDIGLTEDKKKFIANLAEMDKQGEYKIKVDGESLGLDEAITKFKESPEKLEQLMKDQAPKTMQELAEEQLDTLKTIEKNMEAGQQIGYAAAGSKFGTDAMNLTRAATSTGGQLVRATLGKDIKGQSKVIDSVYSSADSLIKVLTGPGSLEEKTKKTADIMAKTGNDFKDALKGIGDVGGKAKTELDNLRASGNKLVSIFDNIASIFSTDKGKTNKSSGLPSPKLPETSEKVNKVIETAGTVFDKTGKENAGAPLDFVITINHDFKNVPTNIDVNQLKEALKVAVPDKEIANVIKNEIAKISNDGGLKGIQ